MHDGRSQVLDSKGGYRWAGFWMERPAQRNYRREKKVETMNSKAIEAEFEVGKVSSGRGGGEVVMW